MMLVLSRCAFVLAASQDIAPPLDYSLIPRWMIFAGTFLLLTILGLILWAVARRRPPAPPPRLPRQVALEELERIGDEIENMSPYQFSIRVSDILRRFVTEQFALPVTRQTSVEFLTALTKSSPFSSEERSLLEDFLGRCDLIKFARYQATTNDSRLLLEEATNFVQGGQLAAT